MGKIYNRQEIDSEHKELVLNKHHEFLQTKTADVSKDRLSRLFSLLVPNTIFCYKKRCFNALRFDMQSLILI